MSTQQQLEATQSMEHCLVVEKDLDIGIGPLWLAWSDPDLLKQWWCPKPYYVSECRLDLRAGGGFYTRMQGPENFDVANEGCFLVVEPYRRVVFGDCLAGDFTPNPDSFFTAEITVESLGENRTRYRAVARHKNQEDRDKHAAMGFQDGWSKCIEQLGELAKSVKDQLVQLEFAVDIEAQPSVVWDTLFGPETYGKWTRVWCKESRFEGDWSLGSRLRFLGPSQDGNVCGMVARVSQRQDLQLLEVVYEGLISQGLEDLDSAGAAAWKGGSECYRLVSLENSTRLEVVTKIPAIWAPMFASTWPKALQNLRVLAELA